MNPRTPANMLLTLSSGKNLSMEDARDAIEDAMRIISDLHGPTAKFRAKDWLDTYFSEED